MRKSFLIQDERNTIMITLVSQKNAPNMFVLLLYGYLKGKVA